MSKLWKYSPHLPQSTHYFIRWNKSPVLNNTARHSFSQPPQIAAETSIPTLIWHRYVSDLSLLRPWSGTGRAGNFQGRLAVKIGEIDKDWQKEVTFMLWNALKSMDFLFHASVRQDIKVCLSCQKHECWQPWAQACLRPGWGGSPIWHTFGQGGGQN